jgi:hypothetical protein
MGHYNPVSSSNYCDLACSNRLYPHGNLRDILAGAARSIIQTTFHAFNLDGVGNVLAAKVDSALRANPRSSNYGLGGALPLFASILSLVPELGLLETGEAASVASEGTTAATVSVAGDSVTDMLMPGGSAIGKAGTSDTIREISGDLSDARAMFGRLSRGGRVVAETSKLTRVELPGGGVVQLRTSMSALSPNTAATIDINIPGINIRKLKFNP